LISFIPLVSTNDIYNDHHHHRKLRPTTITMSDPDLPQVTLIGSPDDQGFTRVTRTKSRQNRTPDSSHPSPFNFPKDSSRTDDDTDDYKEPSASIVATISDEKINQILALTLSLQKDLIMNTNHLAGFDSHLDILDHRLDGIDTTFGEANESVNNLKLDVHALETAKEDDAPKATRRQAHSSSTASPAPADRSDFPRFSGYMGTRTSLRQSVSAKEYYRDVLPAGGNSTSSYVDVTHNMIPNGTSTVHDPTGNGT
jgi:hypothetical protein